MNLGSTEILKIQIYNPTILGFSNAAFVSWTFTFQRGLIPLYLLLGEVTLCGGIALMVFRVKSKKGPKPPN